MSFSRVGNGLSRILANLYIMADEGKSEVPEVNLCSEDENSRDATAEKAARKILRQNSLNRLPPINIPEKIMLCLDVTICCSDFLLLQDKGVEPLLLLKQSVLIFVNNKLDLNPKSEIAIVLMNGSSVCSYLGFSNNKKMIFDKIKKINVPSNKKDEDSDEVLFCLDNLLDYITRDVELPKTKDADVLPPFIVRCIFFYGRSKLLAVDTAKTFFVKLASSPHFFFDSVFLHDSNLDEEIRTEVLEVMGKLDQGYSYILETDNTAINFMNLFAELVSHPLQRPEQKKYCADVHNFKKLLS